MRASMGRPMSLQGAEGRGKQPPWVHSSVVRAADCRSAGPWFKSGCALWSGFCLVPFPLRLGYGIAPHGLGLTNARLRAAFQQPSGMVSGPPSAIDVRCTSSIVPYQPGLHNPSLSMICQESCLGCCPSSAAWINHFGHIFYWLFGLVA